MTLVLDPVVASSRFHAAALCRIECGGAGLDGGLTFWGRKTPVAVLIRDAQGARAFGIDGQAVTEDALEALCPGVMARFAAACGGAAATR